jgi:hypothetical protein
MKPQQIRVALLVLAIPLLGVNMCEPRPTLIAPTGGYVIVQDVLSPVRIRTANLHGAGRIEALMPGGNWVLIHFSPSGGFDFDETLPATVWHCSNPGGTGGCVARLRIADESRPVGYNVTHGTGIVHVCTENYVQRQGRNHCGGRELEYSTGSENEHDIWLSPTKSRAEWQFGSIASGIYRWHGDPWNRLIWASHAFKHSNASSPPQGAAGQESSGTFFDYSWDPEREVNVGLGNTGWHAYSMDIGACSFFIPWEWEQRLEDAYYTAALGGALGNRGLAERFIDEMIETAEPQSRTEVNAMLWVDGTVGIRPNVNASPEFHYRLSDDTGVPQMCFKQYFHANSDISAAPDHWYRFDQAIGSIFLEILPFVGQCGDKDVSFRYCGTPSVDSRGKGSFVVDQSSVVIAHQGYPWAKTLCNNRFVPRFIDGVRKTFSPGGEGAIQIDRGMDTLVSSLSDTLAVDVRRIEMSPRGLYLVIAESTSDPQYGLGDCRSDLDREPALQSASRPTEGWIRYYTRGITRF